MKNLRFLYSMKLRYSDAVTREYFTLKCLPQTDERQKIVDLKVRIEPAEDLGEDVDAFNNRYIYGHALEPHKKFTAQVSGMAYVFDEDDKNSTPVICSKHITDRDILLYHNFTEYTKPGEMIKEYYDRAKREAQLLKILDNDYELAKYFMHGVHHAFKYLQNTTSIETTAEEAWRQGSGVCQDYAHVMISLCRMAKMPARYVVGMLYGEGYSHAWVEVFCGDAWYGFDPTNDVCVSGDHIKISCGRDYKDCLVNRGIFSGSTTQVQEISVIVNSK